MQPGGADATLHRFRIGIAVGLGDGFPAKFLHTGFGILILGIFQFYDVAVLHVGVDFQHRAEENIYITFLRVLLGDGTVETVLRSHGKGEAVDEGLAFLLVALRGIAVQAVGNVAEVGLPVAVVSQSRGKFALFVTAETQVGIVVSIQQIGIELFLHHHVGDGEPCLSLIRAADGEHSEVVEQTDEVVGIGDADGREAVFQFTGDEALTHESLYDGSIVGKLLVLADEHTQFLVVNADVALYHVAWCFAIINVVLDEVKHHIGVVHRGFTVAFLREAVVVVPRFHHLYQLVHAVVEGAVC